MLVICIPHAAVCRVDWLHSAYPTAAACESAAQAVRTWPSMFPDVQGAYCELARKPPKTYRIDRHELP